MNQDTVPLLHIISATVTNRYNYLPSFPVTKQYKCRVLGKMVLREEFRLNRKEVTRNVRKIHNKQLHYLI
jgi:hypothetical protein